MTTIQQKKVILRGLVLTWFLLCLFFVSSSLWSFDLIQVTNTPTEERNHSIAVKGKSIYLAWEAGSAIYFSKSKNEGINWSKPIEISKGFTPSIAVGQNNVVYLVWCKSDTVLSIYSNNDGESFLEYSKKMIGYGHCPAVSIDKKNRIHIVWFHYSNPVYARALHPDSLFSSPVAVDTAYYKWAESMDIVTDDEAQNICIAWTGPSPWYIWANMSVSRNSGASFYKILSDSSYYGDYNLDLVMFSNDEICLVWEGDWGYWYDVLFRKFEDWGQRRVPVRRLNEISAGRGSRSPIYYPSIAVDHDNKIYVVWTYPRYVYKDSTDIYLSVSTDSGQSFRTDTLYYSQKPSSKKNPSIVVMDSATIGIAWEDNRNGNYDIYFALFKNLTLDTVINVTNIDDPKNVTSKCYNLKQNYPNPFNPRTTITFGLPKPTEVKIIIFNLSGQLVAEIFNGRKQAGYHSVTWDASGNSSGIYLIKMVVGDFVQTNKCLFLK